MTVFAALHPLTWESRFFSMNSAQLIPDATQPPVTAAQLDVFDRVQAKINSQHSQMLTALSQMRFQFVEGEAAFSLPVKKACRQPGICIARASHIAVLRQAAARIFVHSRFRQPWYRDGDSARLYAQWIENAVRGEFDDQCLLARDKAGELQGFVTLRDIKNGEGRIGLLATLPHMQGQGAGQRLVGAALDWCRVRGLTLLRIATQLSNPAAMRLYQRCGARLDHTYWWLYR